MKSHITKALALVVTIVSLVIYGSKIKTIIATQPIRQVEFWLFFALIISIILCFLIVSFLADEFRKKLHDTIIKIDKNLEKQVKNVKKECKEDTKIETDKMFIIINNLERNFEDLNNRLDNMPQLIITALKQIK